MVDTVQQAWHTEDDGRGTVDLSPLRVAVLAAAVLWLGGALGWVVAEWGDRPPPPESVAVGFLQDMAIHHEQAIEMALLGLDNNEGETVRVFAEEVLIWQSYELGLIDAQLADWGYSRGERPDMAMSWMDMATSPMAMPGMANEAELAALAAADGAAAEALFLQLMAEHHAGGIHMARYAAANADSGEVRELAARMARNQAIEVAEFAGAADRLGVELPPAVLAAGVDPVTGRPISE